MKWEDMEEWEKPVHYCASHACGNQPSWWGSAGEGEDMVSSTYCTYCKEKIDAAAPRVVSASDLLSATERNGASAFDKTGGGRFS